MVLTSMNLFVTLLIGGVVGWLASILMEVNNQMGILANVVVGIIGSFLGVIVANALGIQTQVVPEAWIVAVLGADLFIWILRALEVFSKVSSAR